VNQLESFICLAKLEFGSKFKIVQISEKKIKKQKKEISYYRAGLTGGA
jgi:hypothetical protein